MIVPTFGFAHGWVRPVLFLPGGGKAHPSIRFRLTPTKTHGVDRCRERDSIRFRFVQSFFFSPALVRRAEAAVSD
jgi:hypothetical protein